MTQVAVIGAGSWGTSASWLLGGKGHSVSMWAREPEIAAGINATHQNPLYMKDIVLPDSVTATPDMERALFGAEAVVMVTPSMGVRSTAESMAPHLPSTTPIVILSKGVEEGSLLLMTEVLEDVLGRDRLAGLTASPACRVPTTLRRSGRASPRRPSSRPTTRVSAACFRTCS